MLKNRFLAAFAVAGLVGLAACGAEEEGDVLIEEPVVEEPAPAPTIEPAPVITDTMGAMPMDSAGAMGAPTTPPTTPQ